MDLVGFGIVVPILPLYAQRFDASPAEIGLLLASFSLAQSVAAPTWGRLSDRLGRKPVLIASLIGTALASLLSAFAPSLAVLFVARLVDGASGGSVAVAQASAADLAPDEQRPRLLGLLGAAYGVGFVIGPGIGALAALAGPRAPFLFAAVLASANAVVTARTLAPSRPRPNARSHIRMDARGHDAALLSVAFLITVAFAGFETTFALVTAERLGFGAVQVSVLFVFAGIVFAATNAWVVAPAVRELGTLRTLRAGVVLEAAGLALLAGTRSVAGVAAAVLILAGGHGVASPALVTAVADRACPARRGSALGLQQSASALARIVGPVAAGGAFGLAGSSVAIGGAAAVAALGLAPTLAVGMDAASSTESPCRPGAKGPTPKGEGFGVAARR